MPNIINADDGSVSGIAGIKQTADSSGALILQANGVNAISISNTAVVTVSSSISGNGAGLTSINASNISSGTVATARLASGTANSSTYLRGDQTWSTVNSSQWTTTGSDIYYNTGNVGIGISSPTQRLDVQAAAGSQARFKTTTGTDASYITVSNNAVLYVGLDNSAGSAITGAAYAGFMYSSANAPLIFINNATEKMRIDASGNVGIGTSSVFDSNTRLELSKSGNCQQFISSTDASGVRLYLSAQGSTVANFGTFSNHALAFRTDDTERMRVTTGGSVGIGTGSSVTSGVTLDVVSPSNNEQFINVLRLKTSNSGDFHPSILFENNRGGVANAIKLCMDSGGTAGTGEFTLRTKDSGGNFNTRLNISNDGILRFNSGYGSVAAAYGTRLWVNFNGSNGAIRGSAGVSSVSKTGTGAYTVNYSITLPDSNYAATCGGGDFAGGDNICTGILSAGGMGTTSIQLLAGLTGGSGGRRDVGVVCLIVTR